MTKRYFTAQCPMCHILDTMQFSDWSETIRDPITGDDVSSQMWRVWACADCEYQWDDVHWDDLNAPEE